MDLMLTEFKMQQEEQRDQIRNHIANIKSKLSTALLDMKLGTLKELAEQSVISYQQVQDRLNSTTGPLANITNQTLNSISMSTSKASRTDDGKCFGIYICLTVFINRINNIYSSHQLMSLKVISVNSRQIRKISQIINV